MGILEGSGGGGIVKLIYLKTANSLQLSTNFFPTSLFAKSMNSSTTKLASFLCSI